MVKASLVLAGLATVALGVGAARADEVKAPVSASMLLRITAPSIEAREVAYDRSLKEAGPAPRPSLVEVLPDGSVKVDRAVITVRNPCPPGHEEPMLPGRRAKK